MAKKIKHRDMSGSKIHRSGHDETVFRAKTAKNTDVIRVSDGKVLAPDETVQLADGNEFVTRPKIEVDGWAPTGGNDLYIRRDAADELLDAEASSRRALMHWVTAANDAEARGDDAGRMTAAELGRAEKLMPGYTAIVFPLADHTKGSDGLIQVAWRDPSVLALATWLWIRGCLRKIAAGEPGFGEAGHSPHRRFSQDAIEMAKSRDELIAAADKARVLAFGSDELRELTNTIDHGCSKAAKITRKEIESNRSVRADENEVWQRWFAVVEHNMPKQIVQPFPVVAIVHGHGSAMTDDDVKNLASTYDESRKNGAQMGIYAAHVIDFDHGDAWQIACCEEANGRAAIHLTRVQRDGEWTRSARMSLQPHALAAMLASSRAFSGKAPERSLMRQKAIERGQREGVVGKIPPPFYVVKQRPSAPKVERLPRAPVPHVPPSYRFDVRSHDRVFVHRGPAPLEPAIEKRLLKRGYRIFAERWPEGLAEACRARGHEDPKRGEWLAVRVVGVRAHLKGPDGSEYVPSLRVPAGGTDAAVVNDAEPSSSANGSADPADG